MSPDVMAVTPVAAPIRLSGQRFPIQPHQGYFRVVNAASSLAVEVYGASPDDGARVIQNIPPAFPPSRQLFEFKRQ